jgi:hypothetical protein
MKLGSLQSALRAAGHAGKAEQIRNARRSGFYSSQCDNKEERKARKAQFIALVAQYTELVSK